MAFIRAYKKGIFQLNLEFVSNTLFHDCFWKQYFAPNSPQASSNLICLIILVTLKPLTQF